MRALLIPLSACGEQSGNASAASTDTTATAATTSSATADTASATTADTAATTSAATATTKEKPMSDYEGKVADVKTTAGDITIAFFPNKAPNHVKNFIDLA